MSAGALFHLFITQRSLFCTRVPLVELFIFRNKRPAIPPQSRKTTLLAANKNYHTRKINTFYLWHCPINQSKKEKGTGWPQITCSSHDQIRPLLTHGGKHLCPNDFELEAGKKKASNLESGEEAIENSRSWH
jgi:hypothetical protein